MSIANRHGVCGTLADIARQRLRRQTLANATDPDSASRRQRQLERGRELQRLAALLFFVAAVFSSRIMVTRAQHRHRHQQRSHRDMDVLMAAHAAKGHTGSVVVAAAPAPSGSSSGSNQAPSSQTASAASVARLLLSLLRPVLAHWSLRRYRRRALGLG
jgi:hypothetical protein